MQTIRDLTTLLLILVPIGGALRVTLCFIYMQMEEDVSHYKKRIRNALVFTVMAECASGLLRLVMSYFCGTV